MRDSIVPVTPPRESLADASVGRLACLLRHWTWADEAMMRFEHELAGGWDYEENLTADRPFGSYYHWCALLCALSEEALERGLLSPLQLSTLRADLEATVGDLRVCRQLLMVIPASFESHPLIADVLRDRERLARLRRVHEFFGALLREERMAREIQSLDT